MTATRWTESADIAEQVEEHNAAVSDEARTAFELGRDGAF